MTRGDHQRRSLGRLVAYVQAIQDTAPILAAWGSFREEIEASGAWDIADHEMPVPQLSGLAMFEGWLQVGPGPDPDVHMDGSWRELSHWEICRFAKGAPPTGDAYWRRQGGALL